MVTMTSKAVFKCHPSSHHFDERHIRLTEPVKIGRSVAKARPTLDNGIFDCKVLSRNHALIWYDFDLSKVRLIFFLVTCSWSCHVVNLFFFVLHFYCSIFIFTQGIVSRSCRNWKFTDIPLKSLQILINAFQWYFGKLVWQFLEMLPQMKKWLHECEI